MFFFQSNLLLGDLFFIKTLLVHLIQIRVAVETARLRCHLTLHLGVRLGLACDVITFLLIGPEPKAALWALRLD